MNANFTLVIVFALVVIILLWLAGLYNRLVRERNLVKEGWSGIDVQLKRRYDLIPNLVETVKGYTQHERGLLENIADLRSKSMNAGSVKEKGEAENALSGTLKTLFAVAEAYPELKANENYIQLQNSLSEIEDQIQLARRYYNGTVRNFNTLVESFPNNLVASSFGFVKEEFFEIEAAEQKEAPEVKF